MRLRIPRVRGSANRPPYRVPTMAEIRAIPQNGLTVGVDFNGRAPHRAHAEMFEVIGPVPAGGINVFQVKDDGSSARVWV